VGVHRHHPQAVGHGRIIQYADDDLCPQVTPMTARPPESAPTGPPAGRYGAARRARDPRLLALAVLVAAALVGWAAWASFGSSGPAVTGQVSGFDVRGQHLIRVDLLVTGDPGPVACRVQAQGRDHDVVGITTSHLRLGSTGRAGLTVAVRTRDTAVTAVVQGCDPARR
jgi:hypothetical protein